MWQDLFAALALVLVLEGILPFINPARWRYVISRVTIQNDQSIRVMGLVSMLVGVVLLYSVR